MEILRLLITATAFKFWFFILIFDIFFLYSYYRGDKNFFNIISFEKSQNIFVVIMLSLILSIPLINWAAILTFLIIGPIMGAIYLIEKLINKLSILRKKNQEKNK